MIEPFIVGYPEIHWSVPQPEPWMDDALCAQTDPDAFFPDKGGSTRNAKSICVSCEVRAQCLAYALEHGERFGIWGGLSERERRTLRRDAA
ncbi:WhiB family transcriptional regulator [Leifsonia bigeumensis]|uniref:Transcriptional regulator WhiB n=2 Tax=Leifsonella bigeumensis TaxID=433643 RepID=A0ABP7F2V8_9MICO